MKSSNIKNFKNRNKQDISKQDTYIKYLETDERINKGKINYI